ncbi:MAG TPA: hypothetical protein VFW06_08780 [Acidimicrobiia bacterium]|nr:hypothetical protein [Acidimicrobiia bacterium]
MRLALGVVALLVGSLGFVGQLVSAIDFRLAQRLGLQESDEGTDRLYRHLELNTARLDLLVIWTLPLAGALMIADHSWWPWAALIAGGIHVDVGIREIGKGRSLAAEGIRVGSPTEARAGIVFLALVAALGLALVVYALTVVT